MNFFEYQEEARKKTIQLVVLFILAVIFFVAAIHISVTVVVWLWVHSSSSFRHVFGIHTFKDTGMRLAIWIPLFTVIVILCATTLKIWSLKRKGGIRVAEELGGVPIKPDTADLHERRLLNVVQEMAIAAGMSPPPVYVLDDQEGINAFAAGYDLADACIAVTRGCLKKLTREELQGVIGHEMSHVLNGDMRLNIQAIGILSGILVFTMMGRVILKGAGRIRSRGIPFFFLGLAFLVIGSIGAFFSRVIKCAISRQREFFADAASVQFTRNPSGLAGALKKIGGYTAGSIVNHTKAEELSHLFFARGSKGWFEHILSTHPSLIKRITRLEPSFHGDFAKIDESDVVITGDEARDLIIGVADDRQGRARDRLYLSPEDLTTSVGSADFERLQYTRRLFSSVPDELLEKARRTDTARHLIYCLLLGDRNNRDEHKLTVDRLNQLLGHDLSDVTSLLKRVTNITEVRLPLASLAIPALKQMTVAEFEDFNGILDKLTDSNTGGSFFEYILKKMVLKHVESALFPKQRLEPYYRSITPVLSHYKNLLSVIAHAGSENEDCAMNAFEMARIRMGIKEKLTIASVSMVSTAMLDQALKVIANASPGIKKQILEACAVCVTMDNTIKIEEAELLRCVADSLGCPVPPFMYDNVKVSGEKRTDTDKVY